MVDIDHIRSALRVFNLQEVATATGVDYMKLWRAVKKEYNLPDEDWLKIDSFINNIIQKDV